MTKEEFLEEIDKERKWLDEAGYTTYNIDIVFSYLRERLKALEQEPKTEPCEDCISRAEAIKTLKELEQEDIETYGCKIPEGFDADEAIEKLKNLPKFIVKADGTIEQIKDCEDCLFKNEWQRIGKLISAVLEKQAEPKTGHWNIVSDGYGENAYICECSECKDTVWVYKNVERKWNYCPNCGARMESEDI